MSNITDYDVVIPVYNGEEFLDEAVNSVLAQTIQPKKIIVIDDGSTDNTSAIIRRISKETLLIDYVFQTNRGLSNARNSGIRRSESPYIAFLDADDVWYDRKIEKQFQIFNKEGASTGVVYTDYEIIDGNGTTNPEKKYFSLDHSVKGDVTQSLLSSNKIAGSASSVLIKRKFLDISGNFDELLRTCEDWDMWLRLSQHCLFAFNPDVLVKIRRTNNNMSNNLESMIVGKVQFFNKYSHLINVKQVFLLGLALCQAFLIKRKKVLDVIDSLIEDPLKIKIVTYWYAFIPAIITAVGMYVVSKIRFFMKTS